MLTKRKHIFFLTFLVLKTQGQITPSLVEPNAYVSAVIDKLWERIKEYGISNLPTEDVSVTLNSTSFGFEITGPVSFEDGFVQDIESVTVDNTKFTTNVGTNVAKIGGNIVFTNMELYRDLRADLTTGLKVGSVVCTSRSLVYTIRLSKEYTNDTVVPTISFSSQSGLDWDMQPYDMTTKLIRRQYMMQNTPGSAFVVSTAEAWIPLFSRFLDEVVASISFPEVTF